MKPQRFTETSFVTSNENSAGTEELYSVILYCMISLLSFFKNRFSKEIYGAHLCEMGSRLKPLLQRNHL